MKGLAIFFTLCLLALFYPPDVLHCWDNAGLQSGSWSETTCDGYRNVGTWEGYVTNDCRFIGTGEWESVTGMINPTTKKFTATGIHRGDCGTVTITGTCSYNLLSVSGQYTYSKGGKGIFNGKLQR